MTTANRVGWAVVGLVLLAAGVLGALASLGKLPIDRTTNLITPEMLARWQSWSGWKFAVGIAVGVVIALLGLWLMLSQLRRRGVDAEPSATSVSQKSTSDTRGRIRVAPSALHHALARDVKRYRDIDRAAVRLTGASRQPEVHLRLAVHGDTDLNDLREHLYGSMERFVSTTGLPASLAEVELTRI
jgi:hypothetical protein